jgi:hypothetical protein
MLTRRQGTAAIVILALAGCTTITTLFSIDSWQSSVNCFLIAVAVVFLMRLVVWLTDGD